MKRCEECGTTTKFHAADCPWNTGNWPVQEADEPADLENGPSPLDVPDRPAVTKYEKAVEAAVVEPYWQDGLREPTEREWEHALKRMDGFAVRYGVHSDGFRRAVLSRAKAVTSRQKAYAFLLALENENLHSLHREVLACLGADCARAGRHLCAGRPGGARRREEP